MKYVSWKWQRYVYWIQQQLYLNTRDGSSMLPNIKKTNQYELWNRFSFKF
jgi:hypothetical protein